MATPNNEKKSKDKYEISAKYKKEEFRGTILNKQHVNLLGKEKEIPREGAKEGAPKTITYIAATQAHLKQYYEMGLMKKPNGELILDPTGKEISNQKIVIKVTDEQPDTTTSDK